MSAQLLAIQAEILAAQARVLGMQAENDQRKACGDSPAYRESCFTDEANFLQALAQDARSA